MESFRSVKGRRVPDRRQFSGITGSQLSGSSSEYNQKNHYDNPGDNAPEQNLFRRNVFKHGILNVTFCFAVVIEMYIYGRFRATSFFDGIGDDRLSTGQMRNGVALRVSAWMDSVKKSMQHYMQTIIRMQWLPD